MVVPFSSLLFAGRGKEFPLQGLIKRCCAKSEGTKVNDQICLKMLEALEGIIFSKSGCPLIRYIAAGLPGLYCHQAGTMDAVDSAQQHIFFVSKKCSLITAAKYSITSWCLPVLFNLMCSNHIDNV
ncbi:MAG: hypothetical protein CVU52_00795 [Deltaproteobacteria bacterium HGW-Deltaproteobacteria-10]|nr:MAG: hypothetical protein CVU52_00795 [Deltaproteobacteria bacterium HGW-Deltaproteobacteria-10]